MSRPDWCPQEVWGAAEAVYDGLSGIEGPLGIEPFRDKDIGTIARALLSAKREGMMDAAEIARGWVLPRTIGAHTSAQDLTARAITVAIRSKAEETVE